MQGDLLKASAWITAKWLDGIMRNAHRAAAETDLAEFGAFQANLAEVIASTMVPISSSPDGAQK